MDPFRPPLVTDAHWNALCATEGHGHCFCRACNLAMRLGPKYGRRLARRLAAVNALVKEQVLVARTAQDALGAASAAAAQADRRLARLRAEQARLLTARVGPEIADRRRREAK